MNIGIVGCGLIGSKRAHSINSRDKLISVCDLNIIKAKKLSSQFSCSHYSNYKEMINKEDLDIIIISTPNFMIKEVALFALKNGKHVLSEKPLGKNYKESQELENCASKNNTILYTGFNHRFHPSVLKAKEIIEKGEIGKLIHIHGHYGHGGRPGMEKEWRSFKKLSGGGELLDQGVHLIDLSILFQGYPKKVYGTTDKLVWKIEVEDSSSFILFGKNNSHSLLSVGWVYWKNKFEMSIYGDLGYLQLIGLGGSYGSERLIFGKRNMKGGKPEIKKLYFKNEDTSWKKEWKHFKNLIKHSKQPKNGHRVNTIVDAIYKSSKIGREIKIK
tara:strand:- start:799 stop:1785 length:987 start_codon:yes stop_codon:yes gene_type:complete